MSGTTVITGASSGIGEALALKLSARGTSLALTGRDAARLEAVAARCRDQGAEVETAIRDVTERDTLQSWLLRLDAAAPVARVIANAGIAVAEDSAEAGYRTIETNLIGALNTVLPLLPAMQARGRGQIVFVSSLAALAPLADAPAYSASKAALLSYGLALREQVRLHGIQVNVACPGFVQTPMGDRYHGWRPFEITAERAAAAILAGVARDQPVIAFPRRLALAARFQGLLPERLIRFGTGAFRFRVEDQGARAQEPHGDDQSSRS